MVAQQKPASPNELRVSSFGGFQLEDGRLPVRMKFGIADGSELRLSIEAADLTRIVADMRDFLDAYVMAHGPMPPDAPHPGTEFSSEALQRVVEA